MNVRPPPSLECSIEVCASVNHVFANRVNACCQRSATSGETRIRFSTASFCRRSSFNRSASDVIADWLAIVADFVPKFVKIVMPRSGSSVKLSFIHATPTSFSTCGVSWIRFESAASLSPGVASSIATIDWLTDHAVSNQLATRFSAYLASANFDQIFNAFKFCCVASSSKDGRNC